jgi:DNA-binding XRE family transcriptional regulator
MYPNLMGMKAYHGLTSDEMGNILGISRNSYESKMKSGRFTPKECKLLCQYFNKSFDYLFATDDEITQGA